MQAVISALDVSFRVGWKRGPLPALGSKQQTRTWGQVNAEYQQHEALFVEMCCIVMHALLSWVDGLAQLAGSGFKGG
jgi:hypothetical protein